MPTALDAIEAVALESVPPLRRRAYEHLCEAKDVTGQREALETPDIAASLGLPTNTVRRALEELAAYKLVKRYTHGAGKADTWRAEAQP